MAYSVHYCIPNIDVPESYQKLKTFIANLIQNYTKIYQSGFINRRLAY